MITQTKATYCGRCWRWYGTDPALIAMSQRVPGSAGYYSAMTSWSGEPCECAEGPLTCVDEDDEPDASLHPSPEA
jgi:hypothetical protein